MSKFDEYARQLAEREVEEQGAGLGSPEAQIQRRQAQIVEELETNEELCRQGYAILMEQVQEREAQQTLVLADDGEDAEPELPPMPPQGMGPGGLDGFLEPGKIIFRP